jgi:hypothetical protein
LGNGYFVIAKPWAVHYNNRNDERFIALRHKALIFSGKACMDEVFRPYDLEAREFRLEDSSGIRYPKTL